MLRAIRAAALLLLLTTYEPAIAGTWDDCNGVALDASSLVVGPQDSICWNVTSADAAASLSELFQVREAAKVCVVPNKDGTPGSLTLDALFLPRGGRGVCSVTTANECNQDSDCPGETCTWPAASSVLDDLIDGTPGGRDTQKVCSPLLGQGTYRCQIGAAAGSGELGACVVVGEPR